ncbi:MAG: hypothetical protein JWN67_3291 [Actinomycetia bacterium]|nr:hypothetical protein [Actinomycetes bacterium]
MIDVEREADARADAPPGTALDVAAYLTAIADRNARRGLRRTAHRLRRRLVQIESELAGASPIERLRLVRERADAVAEIEVLDAGPDLTLLERRFIRVADAYGAVRGIEYAAWRELGVQASVLRHARIWHRP